MSEEIKRERSKNCPNISLSAAIECVKKLHQKAGKAKVKAEVAAGALGYAGLNGAALTTLGALNQYGLVEREKGSMVGVSQAAIRIIHPLSKEQEAQTLQELALNPSVFRELVEGGFQTGAEDLIANHLIQNGFTPQKAKKSASVFKENVLLANLNSESIIKPKAQENFSLENALKDLQDEHDKIYGDPAADKIKGKKVLAQYSIPIGASEATITFTGNKLAVEDFDALADYIAIFKKQFERKQAISVDSTLEKISGTISTQPQKIQNRINFLLAMADGRVLTCISGAGTSFDVSQFVNGKSATLYGQRVADLMTGSDTPMFIFREVGE